MCCASRTRTRRKSPPRCGFSALAFDGIELLLFKQRRSQAAQLRVVLDDQRGSAFRLCLTHVPLLPFAARKPARADLRRVGKRIWSFKRPTSHLLTVRLMNAKAAISFRRRRPRPKLRLRA